MSADQEKKIAYADCFAGVSGDMFLGAILDAGLEPERLRAELAKLDLEEFTLQCTRKQEKGIGAIRVVIEPVASRNGRTWKDIRLLIEKSRLAESVKGKTLQVFTCLAEAEAKIHDCSPDEVHFHEIGGLDSIIDITGSVLGLELLGVEDLICSALPMPRGWVHCEHGKLPLPAPAVCEILQGVPVYGVDIEQELVTPTGAALVKTLSRDFGSLPAMCLARTGYGAGSRKLPGDTPNLFRLIIGHKRQVPESQEVEVIETNLDDWSPEGYPFLCEQLFAHGALDVSLVPSHMKKGRPGFLLQVICDPGSSLGIKTCIFSETSSIGLRFRRENRMTLPRETGTVETVWGPVQVKQVETPTGLKLYPEYEDCCRLALEKGVALMDVYAAVSRCSPEEFEKK